MPPRRSWWGTVEYHPLPVLPSLQASPTGLRHSVTLTVVIVIDDRLASWSGTIALSTRRLAVDAAVERVFGAVAPYTYIGNLPDRTHTASTSSTSSSQQQGYDRYAPHDERQEFSSAFGLMSLDDPNVLAGLANDGQPFFSDPSQSHNQPQQMQEEGQPLGQEIIHDRGVLMSDIGADVDTPMPMKRNSGQLQFPPSIEQQRPSTAGGVPSSSMLGMGGMGTPSKDADARELKEFWKQYMRTPLSGPGPAGVEGGMNFGNNSGSSASPSKNTPLGFRRQRVASLPSAKTPMVELHSFMQGGYGQNPAYQQHQQRQQESSKLGPMSSMRTTLHGNVEDLPAQAQ
ncbi:hypothetical protein NLJ89_g11440 [Agrocybe chaxingu]|uniref:Uncharacterized protein n=1 Tax=Agrocybe chaxingu TaxID=84603 RepID=A0A9W8MR63_9AGAR|nr:hypothetical protein NLJ89_g11440 [Agrocybe chaxingu]